MSKLFKNIFKKDENITQNDQLTDFESKEDLRKYELGMLSKAMWQKAISKGDFADVLSANWFDTLSELRDHIIESYQECSTGDPIEALLKELKEGSLIIIWDSKRQKYTSMMG